MHLVSLAPSPTPSLTRAPLLVALLAFVALLACRDPTVDAAAREARDRAALEQIVAGDANVDALLRAVDEASAKGEDDAAASLLETQAAPAASAALDRARRAPLETAWARARRDDLVALLDERSRAMAPYAAALRGDDLEAKLAAVQAQVTLQRRAMQVVGDVAAGPGADAATSPSSR